jgi:hypothetical protein
MGGDDEESDEDTDTEEDEPEVRDPNLQPLPDHNVPGLSQENGWSVHERRALCSK